MPQNLTREHLNLRSVTIDLFGYSILK
jgi:hypothetical protein